MFLTVVENVKMWFPSKFCGVDTWPTSSHTAAVAAAESRNIPNMPISFRRRCRNVRSSVANSRYDRPHLMDLGLSYRIIYDCQPTTTAFLRHSSITTSSTHYSCFTDWLFIFHCDTDTGIRHQRDPLIFLVDLKLDSKPNCLRYVDIGHAWLAHFISALW